MRRPGSGLSVYRMLVLTGLALCLGLWLPAHAVAHQQVIEITHAQYLLSDAAELPGADEPWLPVALPHRAPKPAGQALVGYWYRASFDYADARQPLWLLLPKLRSGGMVFINGVEVGEIRSADHETQVRWFRPHLMFLPAVLLVQGRNEMAVHFAIREPLTSFGALSVGPEKPQREAYERLLFWEATSTEIASITCLVSGILILVLWSRRLKESLYGLFGICVLLWGLRTFIFRIPEVPMDWWIVWRFAYYVTTGGFLAFITLFLMRFSGAHKPAFERVLIAHWIVGLLGFAAIGQPARPFMDAYWTAGFLPFFVWSVVCLSGFALRQRTGSSMAMVLAILLAFGLALHDFAVQHGIGGFPEFYLLHLGIPAFLLVMAFVLLERFIDSLGRAEAASEELARRIADREWELAGTYRKLGDVERSRATSDERRRIMQEMHDGVGSQLLSTLVMVQRGAATQHETAALLQECLDDMRLAIDSLSPHDNDFLPALGNFRFRMESRFKAMGLALAWRNHGMPDALRIQPHAGLQILRILQEALANVLKHARAARVEIDLHFGARCLRITVQDDGTGMGAGEKSRGHGLMNMHMRADRIGAALSIESATTGTCIVLDVPLPAVTGIDAAMAPARA